MEPKTDELLNAVLASATLAEAKRRFALLPLGAPVFASLLQAIIVGPTHSRYFAIRLSATLGQADQFLPTWLVGLEDPEWVVREAAAEVLREIATEPRVLAKLVQVTLNDSKPHVREAAAQSLGQHLQPLALYDAAARHPFERQRLRAATAVSYSANAVEAEEVLLRLAHDSHWRVRLAAVKGLARLPRTPAIQAMLEARANENESRVKRAAVEVISRPLSASPTSH
jgi:hypothetical protein